MYKYIFVKARYVFIMFRIIKKFELKKYLSFFFVFFLATVAVSDSREGLNPTLMRKRIRENCYEKKQVGLEKILQ